MYTLTLTHGGDLGHSYCRRARRDHDLANDARCSVPAVLVRQYMTCRHEASMDFRVCRHREAQHVTRAVDCASFFRVIRPFVAAVNCKDAMSRTSRCHIVRRRETVLSNQRLGSAHTINYLRSSGHLVFKPVSKDKNLLTFTAESPG